MDNLFEFLNDEDQDFVVEFKDKKDFKLNVNCQKELGDAENDFCNKYYFSANMQNKNGDDLGLISFNIENNDYVFFGVVFVNSNSKNKGVGSKLVEFLEFVAQQKGIANIVGDFDTDDSAAAIFYEKRGYQIIKTNNYEIVQKSIDINNVNENVVVSGLKAQKQTETEK